MSGLAKCFQLEVDPLEMIDLVSYVFFSKIYIFHTEQICAAAFMFYSEYAVFNISVLPYFIPIPTIKHFAQLDSNRGLGQLWPMT